MARFDDAFYEKLQISHRAHGREEHEIEEQEIDDGDEARKVDEIENERGDASEIDRWFDGHDGRHARERMGIMSTQDENGKLLLVDRPGQASRDSGAIPPPPERRTIEREPSSPRSEPRSGDVDPTVCVSPDGHVLSSQGDAEALADATAYVSRLAQLTAESLGMEMFVAMECSLKDEACVVYRSAGGELVALKTRDTEKLRLLREQLEL